MSLRNNLFYNFILSISQIIIPLISIPYISRVLTPEGIGKVSFFDSLTYYFVVFAEFGIVVYGTREVARNRKNPSELKKVVSELIQLHIITSIISIIFFIITILILFSKIDDVRLIYFGITFLFTNSFSCEWYFWGTENFRYIVWRTLLVRIFGLVSIFILIQKPEDYIIYYGIICISAILIHIFNFFKLRKEIDLNLNNTNWKRHIKRTWVIYKISLVYSIVSLLDNVLLGIIGTATAVAFYAFSAKIVRISSALVTDTMLVFFPRSVNLIVNKNISEFHKNVLFSSQLTLLITIPLSTGLWFMSDTLTIVFLGEQFNSVGFNLKIMAIYPILKSFSLLLNKQVLMAFDKEKFILKGLINGAILFILTSIPLCYFFESAGAATALIISESYVLISNYMYARKSAKEIKLIDFNLVIHACIGGILFYPMVYFTEIIVSNLLFRLVLDILGCIFIYCFFLIFIARNKFAISFYKSLKKNQIKINEYHPE